MRVWQLLGPLLAALLAAASCSAEAWAPVAFPPPDISGVYESDGAVGELGTLRLTLRRVEDTSRVYQALLESLSVDGLGESEGVGTLGDAHLILNFDRGLPSDYYFQGNIAGAQAPLGGTFIFPDQAEDLAASFDYQGPPPPLPDEEE